ncbi:GPO family capsid scaffolding protein [Escherichia coli]
MANEKKTSRKKFRVAVSGSTVDGREISPVHLREAAENFNPDVYAARVNVEHYLSPCPSSEFSAMGDVTALSTEDITEGPLAGRTALYAEIEPTERMKQLVADGKKIYSSIELHPQFSVNGRAYLVGLAMTDTPASLGTERLKFTAQQRQAVMTFNSVQGEAPLAALVDSSPDALNTLNELAAALGNDPNFATTMTNALAGKQPKDATLTALAGLATAADRFPYFTGNDVASLATLTKVGRDILAKSTVAAVIEYLGLQETVNRAGNAVQKNGDTLSGGLTFENDSILAWIRNTDWAKIGFKNDADGDTDSYMWFETGDNGNEYFKWRSRQSTTTKDLMTLKWDALNILVNAVINGSLGVGTTNALGGSSIVLGDNDTGFKQNGDGILDVYANSQRVFRFQNGVAIAFKNIQAGDSKKFSLSSSNTSTKNATFNLWGASTRPVVAELGDEAGWHFYSQRNTDNSVIFSVNGQIQPSNWGNFDSRYVKDVRLGTRVVQLMARGGRYEKAGHAITGLRIIGEVDGDDEAIFRPIQKYINGTWYNVAQV